VANQGKSSAPARILIGKSLIAPKTKQTGQIREKGYNA
jgi:hypothetical protein